MLRHGATLLAIDARVKAAQGNLTGAFEDISAIFGMVRHLSGQIRFGWRLEALAWLALEDTLRLAPEGKEPLPPLEIPQLPSLVRQVREELARDDYRDPGWYRAPKESVAYLWDREGAPISAPR